MVLSLENLLVSPYRLFRQAKRAREESESGSDSEEESIPKVGWESPKIPRVGWETTNGFGWFKLCLFFCGVWLRFVVGSDFSVKWIELSRLSTLSFTVFRIVLGFITMQKRRDYFFNGDFCENH